mmetsp:Transcript_11987/g.25882  ORF Transcript_11987/g.25882 Transcript_11987/m.25882 type:complete len:404 (+) Transcript_11987:177-1388(+)
MTLGQRQRLAAANPWRLRLPSDTAAAPVPPSSCDRSSSLAPRPTVTQHRLRLHPFTVLSRIGLIVICILSIAAYINLSTFISSTSFDSFPFQAVAVSATAPNKPEDSKKIIVKQRSQSQDKKLDNGNDGMNTKEPHYSCIAFLHMPKVGGRTMNNFLKEVAAKAGIHNKCQIWPRNHREALKVLQPHITKHCFVFGHFTTALFELNPSILHDCFVMTSLRDPIDRASSAFYFHMHKEEDMDHCLGIGNTTTKDHHHDRTSCRNWWQYSNDMTRRFAGLHDTHWMPSKENPSRYLTAGQPNSTHLAHAKEKLLTQFDLVCFLDDLQSCAEEVMRALCVDPKNITSLGTMQFNSTNKSKTKQRPSSYYGGGNSSGKFRSVNGLDVELYDYAISNIHYYKYDNKNL